MYDFRPFVPTIQHIVCPCNTISDFPQRCPYHGPGGSLVPTRRVSIETQQWPSIPLHPFKPTLPTTDRVIMTPPESPLSDSDVDRIARRLAEIMREPKVDA